MSKNTFNSDIGARFSETDHTRVQGFGIVTYILALFAGFDNLLVHPFHHETTISPRGQNRTRHSPNMSSQTSHWWNVSGDK